MVIQGHHWTFTAISLILVVSRISIRVKYAHRIWLDDVLIMLAWLMVLAATNLYQIEATNLYNHFPLVTGKLPATPQNLKNEASLLYAELAEFVLGFTILLFVKLSNLWFFRRLFFTPGQSPWLKTWWWFVTGWVLASWAVCIGTIPYNWLIKPIHFIMGKLYNPFVNVPPVANVSQNYVRFQKGSLTFGSTYSLAVQQISLQMYSVCITQPWYTSECLLNWNCLCSDCYSCCGPLEHQGTAKEKAYAHRTSLSRNAYHGLGNNSYWVMPNKEASADMSWLCLWAHVEITFGISYFRTPFLFA